MPAPRSFVGAVLLCLFSAGALCGADAVRPPAPVLHEHPTIVDMLQKNNELRRQYGRRPHRIDARLTRAAQNHAWYMARTGEFSHESNGGPWQRARKFGFHAPVRENIAYGYASVDAVFAGWQSSSGHWASIISDTTHAGFGYAVDSAGRGYWVGVYGSVEEPDGEGN